MNVRSLPSLLKVKGIPGSIGIGRGKALQICDCLQWWLNSILNCTNICSARGSGKFLTCGSFRRSKALLRTCVLVCTADIRERVYIIWFLHNVQRCQSYWREPVSWSSFPFALEHKSPGNYAWQVSYTMHKTECESRFTQEHFLTLFCVVWSVTGTSVSRMLSARLLLELVSTLDTKDRCPGDPRRKQT